MGTATASLIFALIAPSSAYAGVQLDSFGVDGPPPPEAQAPTGSSSPAHGAVAQTTGTLPPNDPTVGTLSGQVGVAGGAATYTIPIAVPPGRAGMQPTLALSYNSRTGNGLMGVGWSLTGLSAIHRCPQTPEQDGQTLGVTYSSTDRLCLDGQRLVAFSGSYGAQGTVYHTEVDNYARITQLGGALTGTATCFVVEQRDGHILHYGAVVKGTDNSPTCTSSTNTQVQPKANATLTWLLAKVEDRVGNNQLYTYVNSDSEGSFGSGEVLLSTITYTGFTNSKNVTTAGNRTVSFSYEKRTDAGVSDMSSSYLAGGLSLQTRALKAITTAVNGTTARVYLPTYMASLYSGRLMMNGVTECAGSSCSPTQAQCPASSTGSACHPPTTFVYNDDVLDTTANFPFTSLASIAVPAGSSDQTSTPPQLLHTIGDLDGDGSREVAIQETDAAGEHTYLTQLMGDRQIHALIDLSNTSFNSDPSSYADIDGDGRSELIIAPSSAGTLSFGVWQFPRGTFPTLTAGNTPAQNFVQLFKTVSSNISYPAGAQFYTADFNGDGNLDVAVMATTASCSSGRGVFVYLNALGGASLGSVSSTTFTVANGGSPVLCLSPYTASSVQIIDHVGDFNGDGVPDFFLKTVTTNLDGTGSTHFDGVVVMSLKDATLKTFNTATLTTCASMGMTDSPSQPTLDDCTWSTTTAPNGTKQVTADFAQWIDINGDGLPDFVIARPLQSPPHWEVRLNQGGSMAAEIDTGSGEGLDTGTGNFRYAGRFPNVDVDSDGKPEILVPSTTQGWYGFALKLCTIVIVPVYDGCTGPRCIAYSCPENPGTPGHPGALVMQATDLNDPAYNKFMWQETPAYASYGAQGDAAHPDPGLDNSLYHLSMLKFVQTSATQISIQRIETPLIGRPTGVGELASRSDDLFGDGLADLTSVAGCTGMKVNWGNGASIAQCETIADNSNTYGPGPGYPLPDGTATCGTTLPDGHCYFDENAVLYANINQGIASRVIPKQPALAQVFNESASQAEYGGCPEPANSAQLQQTPILPAVMDAAVNGVGDIATWGYCTLSMPENAYNLPLYSVTGTGVDQRHYYFQSTMPVVYGVLQSPANGGEGGFRSVIYGYRNAIYNHYGRGFQGFDEIIEQEFIPSTSPTATQARAQQTTTNYYEEFPLVGRVSSVQKKDLGTGLIFEQESYAYQCGSGSGGAFSGTFAACKYGNALVTPTGSTVLQPVLTSQTVQNLDPGTQVQYSHINTTNVWDNYGNQSTQTVTRGDDGSNPFVDSHTTTTTNNFASPDANWWVNKLTGVTVNAIVAYNSANHKLPTSASAGTQSLTTSYTYNSDRTAASKTNQNGTSYEQSVTVYCYPSATANGLCLATTATTSYGLPVSMSVCMGTLSGSTCTGDIPSMSPLRMTSFTYSSDGTSASADGYFVLTTKNPLLQVTTTLHEPNDGQVTLAEDPNSVSVKTTYDPFGRIVEIDHLATDGVTAIESAITNSYTSCLTTVFPYSPGSCLLTLAGEEPMATQAYEGNASYRVTTTQTGYPTQVVWYDVLGRAVKKAHAGFNGTYIGTLTAYDDLGTVADTSSPYFVGNTPYLTSYTYDALNRVTEKLVDDSDMDTNHKAKLETDYSYSGRKTTITVHDSTVALSGGACPNSASNLCLGMSRSQNVLGQWMQTIESPMLVAGSTSTLTTNYWTEPLGHVAAIVDAETNLTTATYNELGQRVASSDPDQGAWIFQYDAMGELWKQTDSRSVVTTVNSRDGLGRMTERQEVPPSVTPAGMDDFTELDDWQYDAPYGIGELRNVYRRRGTHTTVPAQSVTPVWSESYTYEQTTARLSTVSTTINESGPQTLASAMSYDGDGRPSTHTYPSGLVTEDGYSSNGQLSSISNATPGSTYNGNVYWTVISENEWDHVTGESYLAGAVTGSHSDYDSTGQAYSLTWGSNDQWTYGYDAFGNRLSQTRTGSAAGSHQGSETFTYDALQRLTQSARGAATTSYAYTGSGNLKYKDDFSAGSKSSTQPYSYTSANARTNGCGPHAAYSVALAGGITATYSCDSNGNVVGGDTVTQATYDADNHPRSLARVYAAVAITCAAGHSDDIFCNGFELPQQTATGGSGQWAYDSNGDRDYEYSPQQGVRYYAPAGYELNTTFNTTKQELGPVIVTGTGASVSVVLRDTLGSTLDVIDSGVLTQRSFDAFGATRNGDFTSRSLGTLNLEPDTIHGFTGHTHEDDVTLIHMNGRIYDYQLGRFLSVDPIIQNPLSSQGINPYSYLGNNPLAGKDPTGYATEEGPGPHVCDGAGSGDAGCSSQMSTQDKIDGFQTVYQYQASGGAGNNGAITGQNNFSVATSSVTSGDQGNPVNDQASQRQGNQSTSSYNGSGCEVPLRCDGNNQQDVNQTGTTLPTINVTGKAGMYATSEQIDALQRLQYDDVQGSDAARETRFFMNDSGTLSGKSQEGCTGTDGCNVPKSEWPAGSTLFAHTHTYNEGATTGVLRSQEQKDAKLSRDMPGPGDAGPLRAGMVSAIVTRGGEKYLIEGSSGAPVARYLGGGNPTVGAYSEQHWQPGANILDMAKDYLDLQREQK